MAGNCGGQRIVHAHFEQHGDPQFRERRPPPPRGRFGRRRADLRRVHHAVLGAVERQAPPPAPERVRLSPARRDRAQRPAHQVGKHLPGQAAAPIAPLTVRERFLEQLEEVLGQRAGAFRHMKRERLQDLIERDTRFAAAATRHLRQVENPRWR